MYQQYTCIIVLAVASLLSLISNTRCGVVERELTSTLQSRGKTEVSTKGSQQNMENTLPNCTVRLHRPSMSPSFYSKPGSLDSMQQITTLIQTSAPPGEKECKVDIGQLLEDVPEDEVLVHYTKFICPRDSQFQLILDNTRGIRRKNLLGYLWTVSCKIFWKDMAVYGQSVDLLVVFLQQWEDQFEEESERYGTPDEKLYDKAFENITSLSLIHLSVKKTEGSTPFPRILTQYTWPQMAELRIQGTPYYSLPTELVQTMPQLQSIEVQNCGLTQPPGFFPLDNGVLYLSRNLSRSPIGNDHYAYSIGIDIVPTQFRRLVDLSQNNITDLTSMQFKGVCDGIVLANNGLHTIGGNTFDGTQHLQLLDLSKNKLVSIPETTFHGLESLRHLNLENNQLASIQPVIFRQLSSLQTISLSNNQLTTVEAGVFTHLYSLEKIDVSSNSLTNLDDDAVQVNSNRLQSVNFANNQLASIPAWVFLVRQLRDVDLSDNTLSFDSVRSALAGMDPDFIYYQNRHTATSYSGPHFKAASEKYVNLRRNNFTTIPMHELNRKDSTTFALVLRFFHLDVVNNPIVCDCNSFYFHQYLSPEVQSTLYNPFPQHHIDSWVCSLPVEVKDVPMVEVPSASFRCVKDTPDCPSTCTCYQRSVDNLIEVDCRNQSLTRMPDTVPPATDALYLDRNNITALNESYPYFQNLTTLTLSYNRLATGAISVLPNFTNLRYISLRNNRLRLVPRALGKMQQLEGISLKNNPLTCECYTKWVKYWLQYRRDAVEDMEDILCMSGESIGEPIVDVEYKCTKSTCKSMCNFFHGLGIDVAEYRNDHRSPTDT